jgi:hypothetical protein
VGNGMCFEQDENLFRKDVTDKALTRQYKMKNENYDFKKIKKRHVVSN